MKLNRREFLTVSAVTGLLGAAAPSAGAYTLPDPPEKARLRLSSQENVAPGKTCGGGIGKRFEELQKALQGREMWEAVNA
jgi:hypothetical protein